MTEKQLKSLVMPGLEENQYQVKPDKADVAEIVKNLTIDKTITKYKYTINNRNYNPTSDVEINTSFSTSNGEKFNKITYIVDDGSGFPGISYNGSQIASIDAGTFEWDFNPEDYRTIIFNEKPTGELKSLLAGIATEEIETTTVVPTPHVATTDQLFSGSYNDLTDKPDHSIYALRTELPKTKEFVKSEDLKNFGNGIKADLIGKSTDNFALLETWQFNEESGEYTTLNNEKKFNVNINFTANGIKYTELIYDGSSSTEQFIYFRNVDGESIKVAHRSSESNDGKWVFNSKCKEITLTELPTDKELINFLEKMATKIDSSSTLLGIYNSLSEDIQNSLSITKEEIKNQIENFEIPKATMEQAGIIQPGTGLGFDTNGKLVTTADSLANATLEWNQITEKPTFFDGNYNNLTNKPDLSGYALKKQIPEAYVLPIASTTTLGGIKIDNKTIQINSAGIVSVNSSNLGSQTIYRTWSE